MKWSPVKSLAASRGLPSTPCAWAGRKCSSRPRSPSASWAGSRSELRERCGARWTGFRAMDMSTPRIAIVAALRREVWPLVKHWPVSRKQSGGHEFAFYGKGRTVVVCGGIGGGPARRAAEAVIQLYGPALVISAGFAGALQADLPVGRVLTPSIVVDTRDGSRASAEAGEGVLVSFDSIADVPQKAKLAEAYAAQAVDMEAAAVARA